LTAAGTWMGSLPMRDMPHQTLQRISPPRRWRRASRSVINPLEVVRIDRPTVASVRGEALFLIVWTLAASAWLQKTNPAPSSPRQPAGSPALRFFFEDKIIASQSPHCIEFVKPTQ